MDNREQNGPFTMWVSYCTADNYCWPTTIYCSCVAIIGIFSGALLTNSQQYHFQVEPIKRLGHRVLLRISPFMVFWSVWGFQNPKLISLLSMVVTDLTTVSIGIGCLTLLTKLFKHATHVGACTVIKFKMNKKLYLIAAAFYIVFIIVDVLMYMTDRFWPRGFLNVFSCAFWIIFSFAIWFILRQTIQNYEKVKYEILAYDQSQKPNSPSCILDKGKKNMIKKFFTIIPASMVAGAFHGIEAYISFSDFERPAYAPLGWKEVVCYVLQSWSLLFCIFYGWIDIRCLVPKELQEQSEGLSTSYGTGTLTKKPMNKVLKAFGGDIDEVPRWGY